MKLQLALASWLLGAQAMAANTKGRPNILFILTDDQDTHMESIEHMPFLQKHLMFEGAIFKSHYCTVAICCPSRVNLWTGQLPHNTNVTDLTPPYGGYPKFVENGYNENHLGLWMQQSGYNTYYAGKLYNSHSVYNYHSPYVSGYTASEFILDPSTYQYWNWTTTRNGQPPVNVVGKYSPDATAAMAYGFLDEALESEKPFFLTVAPIAPHADASIEPYVHSGPPGVAKRHEHLFKDYKIPRRDNFNPDVPSGVSWVKTLDKLNDTVVEYLDEYQRRRLRALQSVDEMIDSLVRQLDDAGVLDNTYIFYSTDNGYHIGQHRMNPGKEAGFDTDINIPLLVRGPGVTAGQVRNDPTSHTDLAPTFLDIAGITVNDFLFDGRPIELQKPETPKSEHVAIAFWGDAIPEGKYGYKGHYPVVDNPEEAYQNNTYKGLRLVSEKYSLYYSVWCTNEKELYDMKKDPGQMHNLLAETSQSKPKKLLGRDLQNVVDRLDALMMVTKSCKGESCIEPWKSLHPTGKKVSNLEDALDDNFDDFYKKQPKVSFTKCELGYIRESEGPQDVVRFDGQGSGYLDGGSQKPMYNPHWALMT